MKKQKLKKARMRPALWLYGDDIRITYPCGKVWCGNSAKYIKTKKSKSCCENIDICFAVDYYEFVGCL